MSADEFLYLILLGLYTFCFVQSSEMYQTIPLSKANSVNGSRGIMRNHYGTRNFENEKDSGLDNKPPFWIERHPDNTELVHKYHVPLENTLDKGLSPRMLASRRLPIAVDYFFLPRYRSLGNAVEREPQSTQLLESSSNYDKSPNNELNDPDYTSKEVHASSKYLFEDEYTFTEKEGSISSMEITEDIPQNHSPKSTEKLGNTEELFLNDYFPNQPSYRQKIPKTSLKAIENSSFETRINSASTTSTQAELSTRSLTSRNTLSPDIPENIQELLNEKDAE